MKKICINPVDDQISLMLESLSILNSFKELGFTSRSGFVGVVQNLLPEFKEYDNLKRLLSFWDGRHKSAELNEVLSVLIIKLKQE